MNQRVCKTVPLNVVLGTQHTSNTYTGTQGVTEARTETVATETFANRLCDFVADVTRSKGNEGDA